jgi:membrane-anchored protein YejM (alkaline phosphatase superfamily)
MPDYECSAVVDNEKYDAEHAVRYDADGRELVLETEEQFKHYHVNMAAMIEMGKWFDYLRKEDVFDNTRIILVSDHGWGKLTAEDTSLFPNDSSYFTKGIFYPVLMVKDFNSTELTVDSSFMTNADVPVLALKDLIPNAENPYTGKPIDSSEKLNHRQYLFVSFDKTENPNDIYPPEAPWIAVSEDMRDLSNWTLINEHQRISDYSLE